jgi:hypothetical protein
LREGCASALRPAGRIFFPWTSFGVHLKRDYIFARDNGLWEKTTQYADKQLGSRQHSFYFFYKMVRAFLL